MKKLIAIAADHAAYQLKEQLVSLLKENGYQVEDLGCHSEESVHYPLYAQELARFVLANDCLGILVCGTGIGMSISANRFKGIRAALCHSVDYAKLSREHNNSNVLVLGARFTSLEEAKAITDTWLNTEFLGARHGDRIKLIEQM